MTWKGDPRTTTAAWRRLRLTILARDGYVCYVCGQPGADEVDHLHSHARCIAEGIDPDDPANLASIHDNPCHRRKSGREGQRAATLVRPRQRRPDEQHPGLT